MTTTDLLCVGPLEVDVYRRLVTVDGEPVELSCMEYTILCRLAREPDRCFPKTELVEHLWGPAQSFRRTRTLDSHACRLRKKLGGGFVLNVWGVGYRLVAALP